MKKKDDIWAILFVLDTITKQIALPVVSNSTYQSEIGLCTDRQLFHVQFKIIIFQSYSFKYNDILKIL